MSRVLQILIDAFDRYWPFIVLTLLLAALLADHAFLIRVAVTP